MLKVNIHCDGCEKKVKKILHKIDGKKDFLNLKLLVFLSIQRCSPGSVLCYFVLLLSRNDG